MMVYRYEGVGQFLDADVVPWDDRREAIRAALAVQEGSKKSYTIEFKDYDADVVRSVTALLTAEAAEKIASILCGWLKE